MTPRSWKTLTTTGLLLWLGACAAPEEAAMMEPAPIVAEEAVMEKRAVICQPGETDDGIGGTGCEPEIN